MWYRLLVDRAGLISCLLCFSWLNHDDRAEREEHVARQGTTKDTKHTKDTNTVDRAEREEHVARQGTTKDTKHTKDTNTVDREEREEHVGRIGKMACCADEMRQLASEVGQVAYDVHKYFGQGLLEKVYETALEHRLLKAGYKVARQQPL